MKATEAKLLDFLKKSPQFVIPIYQRTYSWSESECRQLWEDILRTGENDRIHTHFVGSIVYIEKGLYQISSQSPLLVIDGQQRLTTVSLILEALARAIPEGVEPVDGFSAKKLRNYYLLNPLEDGERGYKLLLTQTDKQTLLSLLEQKPFPDPHSIRLKGNFELFEKLVASLGDDLATLCKGIAKLMVVDIALNREQDNPQLIFESMNSTGKELSQADLIRNFVLMGLEPDHQTRLYEGHWRPMELAFGQEAYGQHFDGFMRNFLTVKTGDIPRVGEVYEAFKGYVQTPQVSEAGIDAMVADVHTFADHYCAMVLGKEIVPLLRTAFSDLRELKIDVAYPLLLELYHDYEGGMLSKEDLAQMVRWIESYVFRRAVCSIPTNSMNMTFGNFGKAIDKDRYLESLQAHFLLLPSYRRFPLDEEFRREIKQRDLYNFRSRSYWLRRIENHGRKERVPVDEYTIEHIMPQNPDLSSEWHNALGGGLGAGPRDLAAHPGQPVSDRLQLRVQRPPLRAQARHAGRFQGEPPATQRGSGATGQLERRADPDPRRSPGAAGGQGMGRSLALGRDAGDLSAGKGREGNEIHHRESQAPRGSGWLPRALRRAAQGSAGA